MILTTSFYQKKEDQEVADFSVKLKMVNKIKLKLKRDGVMVSQVRKIFAHAIKYFPLTHSGLEDDSDIVKSAVTESALVKL